MPTKEQLQGRVRSQRWRERHPGAGAAASRRYRKVHGNTPWPAKRELGLFVQKLKEKPCTDCRACYPTECMDWDHVRGKKLYNIGTMVAHGHSKAAVLRELAKCELVCANCHRVRTRERRRRG